jgi:hypothetical protein
MSSDQREAVAKAIYEAWAEHEWKRTGEEMPMWSTVKTVTGNLGSYPTVGRFYGLALAEADAAIKAYEHAA